MLPLFTSSTFPFRSHHRRSHRRVLETSSVRLTCLVMYSDQWTSLKAGTLYLMHGDRSLPAYLVVHFSWIGSPLHQTLLALGKGFEFQVAFEHFQLFPAIDYTCKGRVLQFFKKHFLSLSAPPVISLSKDKYFTMHTFIKFNMLRRRLCSISGVRS